MIRKMFERGANVDSWHWHQGQVLTKGKGRGWWFLFSFFFFFFCHPFQKRTPLAISAIYGKFSDWPDNAAYKELLLLGRYAT